MDLSKFRKDSPFIERRLCILLEKRLNLFSIRVLNPFFVQFPHHLSKFQKDSPFIEQRRWPCIFLYFSMDHRSISPIIRHDSFKFRRDSSKRFSFHRATRSRIMSPFLRKNGRIYFLYASRIHFATFKIPHHWSLTKTRRELCLLLALYRPSTNCISIRSSFLQAVEIDCTLPRVQLYA